MKKILSAFLVCGVTLSTLSTVPVSAGEHPTTIEDTAQSRLADLQAQVSDLEIQKEQLTKETSELQEESSQLTEDIKSLSSKIDSRKDSLNKQARSAQVNNKATSYIDVILNSKSISDTINRVTAINTLVDANQEMLEKQKSDKIELEKAQAEIEQKVSDIVEKQVQINEQADQLAIKQAELEVAKIDVDIETVGQTEELIVKRQEASANVESVTQTITNPTVEVTPVVDDVQEVVSGAGQAMVQTVEQTVEQPIASTTASPVVTDPSNTYPVGQCTWGVKEVAPWAHNYWGNGADWAASAAAAGFRTGFTPQVGAIVVWGGGYGHVAYVTHVNGDQIQVLESNYAGNMSIANYRGWFSPGAVTYIYPN